MTNTVRNLDQLEVALFEAFNAATADINDGEFKKYEDSNDLAARQVAIANSIVAIETLKSRRLGQI